MTVCVARGGACGSSSQSELTRRSACHEILRGRNAVGEKVFDGRLVSFTFEEEEEEHEEDD